MSTLEELKEAINYDKTFACVQCGYCLPACPTYETMGKETHSPRGRINLVKMVAEGKMELEQLREPIDKCLGCFACVTACPVNVEYDRILESAKVYLTKHKKKSVKEKVIKHVVLKKLFPSSSWMDTFGRFMWGYQKSGLQALARNTKITKLAPAHLGEFEAVLPEMVSHKERNEMPSLIQAEGKQKAKVGFFAGCIMDSVFNKTNQNTIALLSRAGAEVVIPETQTCCGALHAHSGEVDDAKELAKRNIQAFEDAELDYIINNAGGCGAMLVEYDHLLENEPEWKERAKLFVERTRDISQVLMELDGLEFTKDINETITYQASCHLTNVQKVVNEPLELIKKLPGINFKQMEGYDRCCGSAGVYNIVNYDDSMEILDGKMEKFKPTKATTIVTTNPGCLLQMKMGIKREDLDHTVRAVHLVDLLMEADPRPKDVN